VELNYEVKREKIVLNDVEFKMMENGIFYIQIRTFGEKVNTQFVQALEALKKEPNVKKVVIDLRNNPG
jgi:carboxyl-terminal processing protease